MSLSPATIIYRVITMVVSPAKFVPAIGYLIYQIMASPTCQWWDVACMTANVANLYTAGVAAISVLIQAALYMPADYYINFEWDLMNLSSAARVDPFINPFLVLNSWVVVAYTSVISGYYIYQAAVNLSTAGSIFTPAKI